MKISDTYIESFKFKLEALLRGGFAPNVILLREFDYNKTGIILDGLHFSAWMLLGHIRWRHNIFLEFLKSPKDPIDLWPGTYWPENYQPKSQEEWFSEIEKYESEREEMITILMDIKTDLFTEYNGNSFLWAAMTVVHHTGYHIGQLKTIGRQLGVW